MEQTHGINERVIHKLMFSDNAEKMPTIWLGMLYINTTNPMPLSNKVAKEIFRLEEIRPIKIKKREKSAEVDDDRMVNVSFTAYNVTLKRKRVYELLDISFAGHVGTEIHCSDEQDNVYIATKVYAHSRNRCLKNLCRWYQQKYNECL